jgi:protein BCP1
MTCVYSSRLHLPCLPIGQPQGEPYEFTHLLFISRTYRLSQDDELAQQSQPQPTSAPRSKRARRQKAAIPAPAPPPDGIFSFHPEDECIMQVCHTQHRIFSYTHCFPQFASHTLTYTFTRGQNQTHPREKDAFGLDTGGRMMLVPATRFPEAISRMGETYAAT